MDSDRLNRWLTLLANVGVLIGIVFLALELRQNSELTRAQTRMQMSQDTIGMLTLNVNDPVYIDTIMRGLAGEQLSPAESTQFRRTYNAWIWHWNNLVYQHRMGLYDDAEFELQISVVRRDMRTFPGLKKHWCRYSARELTAETSGDLIRAIEGEEESDFCRDYRD